MINKDCFAYKNDNYCIALTTMLCRKKKCPFYKTHKQRKEDLEKYPPVDYKAIYENKHKGDEKNE